MAPTESISVGRVALSERLAELTAQWSRPAFLEMSQAVVKVVNYTYFKAQEDVRAMVHEGELWGEKGDTEAQRRRNDAALRSLLKLLALAKYRPLEENVFLYGVHSTNFSRALHADLGLDLTKPHPTLQRVLSKHPLFHPHPVPLYCNRILLFTSGYTEITTKGMFLYGKCNALLEIIGGWVARVLHRVGLMDLVEEEEEREEVASKGGEAGCIFEKRRGPAVQNIRDALGVSLLNFFRPIEVKETAFEQLFVIYPEPVKEQFLLSKPTLSSLINAFTNSTRQTDQKASATQTEQQTYQLTYDIQEMPQDVSLSLYTRLPCRDLCLVLPEKLLSTTNLDTLMIVIEIVLCVVLLRECIDLVSALSFAANGDNLTTVLLLLSSIPTLIYRICMVLTGWMGAVDYYKSAAKCYLDTKLSAAGKAAAQGLYESVKDQEVKGCLLAYWLLWEKGDMTPKVLDREAEILLKREFDTEVDFDVAGALALLQSLGMAGRVAGSAQWRSLLTPAEFLNQPVVPWSTYLKDVRESLK